jgi:hypothetical protein
MSMLRRRRHSAQLPLFACPNSKQQTGPSWTALSTDVQEKILQLLAQLLQRHCSKNRGAGVVKEAGSE